jgi:hypothetical protein
VDKAAKQSGSGFEREHHCSRSIHSLDVEFYTEGRFGTRISRHRMYKNFLDVPRILEIVPHQYKNIKTMSTKSVPSVKPPRISARIEARQRRNESRNTPGWITPTRNNEEKRLVMALMDHLRATSEDMEIL